MQKIHALGTNEARYFWNINTNLTSGEYRSRCATANAVRSQLRKFGHTVKSVTPAKMG